MGGVFKKVQFESLEVKASTLLLRVRVERLLNCRFRNIDTIISRHERRPALAMYLIMMQSSRGTLISSPKKTIGRAETFVTEELGNYESTRWWNLCYASGSCF